MAVGRAFSLKYTKYRVLGWVWLGTGIALPGTHPAYPTPGTPPPTWYTQHVNAGYVTASNSAGGLRSVDQLTLSA